MITLIVLGVAVVVLAVWVGVKERSGEAAVMAFGLGIVGALVVAPLLSLPVLAFNGDHYVGENRIYSLRHFDSTSGHFFLGCGSINGRRQYVVFEKTPRGMKQRFYSRHNTYIQEGADTPYAEFHYIAPKRWHRMAFPMVLIDKYPQSDEDYTILHVPTGTVTQEFTLE